MFIRKRKHKNILKHEDGGTAIEFGLITPVLFLMIMGIVELGLITYANSVLDGVMTYAARISVTGDDYSGDFPGITYSSREELITKLLKNKASVLLDPAKVNISTEVLSGITALAPIASPANIYGSGGQAVIYTVEYPWKIFTPLMADIFGDANGDYLLSSSIVVKNEDF